MAERKGFLHDLPAQNKDNFKIYHENEGGRPGFPRQKNINNMLHKLSIYPSTPDTPLEQKIVNESKPQPTLNYLRVRGGQYNNLEHNDRNPAKRKKTIGVKAQR